MSISTRKDRFKKHTVNKFNMKQNNEETHKQHKNDGLLNSEFLGHKFRASASLLGAPGLTRLGARTLLGTKGIATSNKKLLQSISAKTHLGRQQGLLIHALRRLENSQVSACSLFLLASLLLVVRDLFLVAMHLFLLASLLLVSACSLSWCPILSILFNGLQPNSDGLQPNSPILSILSSSFSFFFFLFLFSLSGTKQSDQKSFSKGSFGFFSNH